MKKHICASLLLIAFLAFVSCSTAMKREEIDPWLQNMAGDTSPEIHIEGWWKDAHTDAAFGWGRGRIEQDGNKIDGAMGQYNLRGRISGNTVYLVFLSAGEVHYTGRLEMIEDGLLQGNYFPADDLAQEYGTPIALEKFER